MSADTGQSSTGEGTEGRGREPNKTDNATETDTALDTVLDVDILQTIFSSNILSPRDRARISCVSKAFKALVFKSLLSEIIWTKSSSMYKTIQAFDSVYSEHSAFVRKLTVDIPSVEYGTKLGIREDMPRKVPKNIETFMIQFSRLQSLDVVAGFTFFWWEYLAAFLKVSSLRSFTLTISDKCVVVPPVVMYDRLRNESFTSWNQLERLKIIFDHYSGHPVPLNMNNLNWVKSFLKISTVRNLSLESIWNNDRFVRYDLRLPSLRHLNTLRITTVCGERDGNMDRLLQVVSTLRSNVRVYLHLTIGKGREDNMQPAKVCPHGRPKLCSVEVDGPVELTLHYLKRWKSSETYYPCGLQLYQSGPGEKINLSLTSLSRCDELQFIEDTVSLRAYADIGNLSIASCTLDLDFIFGISQVCPNIVSLEIQKVQNESELDDHLYTIFGTDVLPSLHKLTTLHIPLTSFLRREQYMKEYLSGWSRYCPSLRNVVLVPGTQWIRRSPQTAWETITNIPISAIEGLEQLKL